VQGRTYCIDQRVDWEQQVPRRQHICVNGRFLDYLYTIFLCYVPRRCQLQGYRNLLICVFLRLKGIVIIGRHNLYLMVFKRWRLYLWHSEKMHLCLQKLKTLLKKVHNSTSWLHRPLCSEK